ncbi:MAG: membrane protein insertion efficiency factor YidD [Fuerstiella sp.]|nr:membrane protein insertion efficiency factor YidD [Fuerstiella sp.]
MQSRLPILSFWINLVLLVFRLPGTMVILLIRCYQKLLSPLLGRTCRFHPSCSEYFVLAVRKQGLLIGCWKGICRISRCHPWHPGGYDPP